MEKISEAKKALGNVIYGNEHVIDLLFIALIAEGHILFESVPGTGKTKLAKSFAKSIAGAFNRIQFTPDVLPSDVTGIRYFNPKTEAFQLRTGPVLTNVLLADEINRATPKTQSSLLEVMEEYQATIDGETVKIDRPFIVIATQNPVESHYGTFPLPEAQLDRFLFKVSIDYPSYEAEQKILATYRTVDPYETIDSILTLSHIRSLQVKVKDVHISEVVADYLLKLVHETRKHVDIEVGISPRGMLALMRASQSYALLAGRNYVSPNDIKQLTPYVFEHRIILTMDSSLKKTSQEIVAEILDRVDVPVEYEDETV